MLGDRDVLEEQVADDDRVLSGADDTLDPGADLVVADAPAGEDRRGVVHEELLSLVVQGDGLGRVRLSAGLGHESVELGALVPLVVVAALALEEHAEEVVRVRVVRAPGVPGDARRRCSGGRRRTGRTSRP